MRVRDARCAYHTGVFAALLELPNARRQAGELVIVECRHFRGRNWGGDVRQEHGVDDVFDGVVISKTNLEGGFRHVVVDRKDVGPGRRNL